MQNIRAFSAGLPLVLCVMLGATTAKADTAFMTLGVMTTAPIGHHLFCIETPTECLPAGPSAEPPLTLTPGTIAAIAAINVAVNSEVEPISDYDLHGVEERWSYPDRRGDCEDFALLKRQRLQAAGIAASNLLITVVNKRNGEGHAVLTLRTASGDFVLDNLDWRVQAWRDTSYAFVKRQSASDPRKWIEIDGGSEQLVGALGR